MNDDDDDGWRNGTFHMRRKEMATREVYKISSVLANTKKNQPIVYKVMAWLYENRCWYCHVIYESSKELILHKLHIGAWLCIVWMPCYLLIYLIIWKTKLIILYLTTSCLLHDSVCSTFMSHIYAYLLIRFLTLLFDKSMFAYRCLPIGCLRDFVEVGF